MIISISSMTTMVIAVPPSPMIVSTIPSMTSVTPTVATAMASPITSSMAASSVAETPSMAVSKISFLYPTLFIFSTYIRAIHKKVR